MSRLAKTCPRCGNRLGKNGFLYYVLNPQTNAPERVCKQCETEYAHERGYKPVTTLELGEIMAQRIA